MDKKKIIIISSIAAILLIVIPALIFIYTPGSAPYHINQNAVELPPESPADPPAPVAFTIAPTALGDISITALSTSDLGVATDTAFLITSDVHTLAEAHLLAYLSAGNGNSFTLEAQPDNAFLLRFEDDLTPNQIYNLIYSPPGRQAASHAFQTADIFRVTATSPANHAHGVPYDAGIEVTFSQPLADDTDFEAAFSIDPPVEGRFYQRDNIFIFAPYALDYSIRYTVTIAQGLVSATGEVLEEDHVFTFNTLWGSGSGPAFSMFGNPYETFLPWDEIFISIGLGWEFEGRDFYVSLYDMEEWEAFIAAGIDESVTGTLIDTFELEAQDFEVDWQPVGYLFLDRTLPVGYYMAVIRSTQEDIDITLRKFIQVSALSVYSLSIEDETVFWVNDASTGQPASGAQVSLNAGGLAATTDSDGVAIIAIPEEIVAEVENNRLVITIEHANHLPFAYTKPVFDRSHPQISDRFLSFIYTDRPTYRPTDTVDVFGVIQPRYGHAHSPNDVFTLHFGNMLELPIELSRFNTFSVRVPIADMFSGVSVSVQINGEWLASRWISIADYANHSYVISGELDRLAYFLGERAEAELHVTSFAGRPVPGVQLTTHSHGEAINTTTNNNGLATASVFVPSHYRGWMPFWGSFWFSITSEIQTSQSITLPMIVAPSDVMMEHEISGDTATITTSQVLLDNIEAHYADVSPWSNINPDNFRGDPVDVNFTITINRYTTTRTVRTRQYDHINRRTINVYQFDTESELYRVLMGNTVDGQTIVTGLPVSNDPMIRYSIEVTYEDTQQRPVTVWLSDQNWWPGRDAVQESPVRHFSFALDRWMLGIGETTQVSLVENPDPWGEWRWHGSGADENSVPVTQGRMITILARDGVETVAVGSPRGIPITFTENLISSAVIFGAYFDGRYIFPIANFSNPPTIWFNHADRELEIELEFDQDSYRPGDEVTVTIQTSAPGQVAISVVDESSLMDRWHEVNFLQRFYQSAMANFWAMRPTQFSSHTQHNIADHHDRGGFGGEHEYAATADSPADAFAASDPTFRDFFVDNPAFEVVETDSNGVATLTFTLADQVTSWRVTALGITEDGYAGDTRYNIISYLPFYVDLILTNEYIAGDDVAALARTFGSDEEPVDFTFNVLHDGEVI
ncbi:MAG: Ig-like domain-containing protein, partial [Defluviitaleaceae bacterium]|nr:Ig-like domain-containing protein [Defluviitaleaceae bacterium]